MKRIITICTLAFISMSIYAEKQSALRHFAKQTKDIEIQLDQIQKEKQTIYNNILKSFKEKQSRHLAENSTNVPQQESTLQKLSIEEEKLTDLLTDIEKSKDDHLINLLNNVFELIPWISNEHDDDATGLDNPRHNSTTTGHIVVPNAETLTTDHPMDGLNYIR